MRTARYTVALLVVCFAVPSFAQVPYERLKNASSEPENWLTYGGNYGSQRFSGLKQITPENVANLRVAWAYQLRGGGVMESSPVIVDGIMYVTEPQSMRARESRCGITCRQCRVTSFP
jgi:glucose dehydrogenase